jgi:hypothetical protein
VRATYIESKELCQSRDARQFVESKFVYFTLFQGESFDISPNLAFASSIFFQKHHVSTTMRSTRLQ